MRAMTVDHEKWVEFAQRLAGPEGCKFRVGANGRMEWECAGGLDKTLAVGILERMGEDIDIPATLEYLAQHGGYCDCKIIFQVVRSHGVFLHTADGQEICHPDERWDHYHPAKEEQT